MVNRRTVLRAGAGAVGLAVAGAPLWSAAEARPATGAARWAQLRRSFTGDVVLPGDPAYDQARQLDSKAFDGVRPQAIAFCENSSDVRLCLNFAQDNDIQVALRSGGHSAAGYSTGTGLVLDTSRLNQVKVGRSTTTIGPGSQGVDIVNALAPSGLAAVTGNCATVCAGGYLQGGGIGPLARKFGIAADRLVSAEVVLPNGRIVRCSEHRERELFWALRGGGGGNFGVVTRYEIKPGNVTRMVSFSLSWPWEQAANVITAYLPWLAQAPDDLTANLTVMNQNAAPGSKPTVLVSGGWLGGPVSGLDPHLNELVSAVGAAPATRSADDLTYQQAIMRMFGCGDKTVDQCHRVGYNPEAMLQRQSLVMARGRLFEGELNGTGIDEALTAFEANPVAGQFRVMSFGGLGGQINRTPRTATAYVHRTAQHYFTFTSGVRTPVPTPEEKAAVEAWTDGGYAVAERYGDGEGQVNFIDSRLPDWRSAYYGENYHRLLRAKRRYDPHGFFRFAQGIGA
ncbi:FAD-binding oxidoreductase [Amycolatopsis nigrescens]|uniref:FAD-binding oxidoreductase n=1 Tax=Amycolatopsis nigrescens TaxID=381445 RepID=UPI000369416B|nr:FAD-binding protein [Amycolatopsis nigrescens]